MADEIKLVKASRPTILGGITIKVPTGCGNMYVQMNWCHGRLFEMFATLGKTGACAESHMEALTRSITLTLRCTPDGAVHDYVHEVIDQFRGIRCPTPIPFPRETAALSCADAIACTLIKYGDLTTEQVVSLILDANDVKPLNFAPGSPEEEAEAKKAMEDLAAKRREDGVD